MIMSIYLNHFHLFDNTRFEKASAFGILRNSAGGLGGGGRISAAGASPTEKELRPKSYTFEKRRLVLVSSWVLTSL